MCVCACACAVRVRKCGAFVRGANRQQEDQFSHLNVYVYEERESNLYIHHDIVLAEFPLCVEWMHYTPPVVDEEASAPGSSNFVAVGTFSEAIEVWNLDLIDVMHPTLTLGGKEEVPAVDTSGATANAKKRMKKKQKKKALNASLKPGSHAGAVMCLSWNQGISNVLASGSADHTAKLWDLNTGNCLLTFPHHQDKVQVCKWHPVETK